MILKSYAKCLAHSGSVISKCLLNWIWSLWVCPCLHLKTVIFKKVYEYGTVRGGTDDDIKEHGHKQGSKYIRIKIKLGREGKIHWYITGYHLNSIVICLMEMVFLQMFSNETSLIKHKNKINISTINVKKHF